MRESHSLGCLDKRPTRWVRDVVAIELLAVRTERRECRARRRHTHTTMIDLRGQTGASEPRTLLYPACDVSRCDSTEALAIALSLIASDAPAYDFDDWPTRLTFCDASNIGLIGFYRYDLTSRCCNR